MSSWVASNATSASTKHSALLNSMHCRCVGWSPEKATTCDTPPNCLRKDIAQPASVTSNLYFPMDSSVMPGMAESSGSAIEILSFSGVSSYFRHRTNTNG